jgi:tetratricopeptide (TPR) repeat protein
MQNLDKIQGNFLAGRYKEVIEITGRYFLNPISLHFHEVSTFQIGALVFLGELIEARTLFSKALEFGCPDSFLITCRFFLGIGHVRYSQFREAEVLFAKNLWLMKKNRLLRASKFHALQGAAFFKLNRGQFVKCEAYALAAYQTAFEEEYLYGQILALELLAISHCQMGKIRLGLHEFEKSLALVKNLGNGGIETALKVSLIRYRALYGVDMLNSEEEIRKALRELRPQDTYSKADLVLELARQLILRGKTSEAQSILDQTCELIYKHQNKRQTALFNHRYAHILFLKGENRGALTLLRTAMASLDSEFDSVILRQFQGFVRLISGTPAPFENIINLPDSRIQGRQLGIVDFDVIKGEDPLGDLIDSLSQNGHLLIAELKRLRLHGLIPRALGIGLSGSQIIFGPERGQLILIRTGDVTCIESGLTSPMKKLLTLLKCSHSRSKEFLIRQTWGYEYNPMIHDKLLYSTLAKLRGILAPYSYLIEWSQDGYRLASEVQLHDPFSSSKINDTQDVVIPSGIKKQFPTKFHQFNMRQLKALKQIERGEALDVSSYAIKFRVSKMTACRDLTALASSGMVFKVGRARATKYVGEKLL